jgi:prepilin-type processing-associated H-X9-DG protein
MQARRPIASPHARSGITMLEVLVLIGIFIMLAALILPAIRSGGRTVPRKIHCIYNLKNLGLAIQTRASLENDTLPYLDEGNVGWPRMILAEIGESAALRKGDFEGKVQVFTCPDDPNNFNVSGGLSYRANSGYAGVYSVTSDPRNEWSLANYRRSGVMFSKSLVPKRVRLYEVDSGDGVSNTLLLSERADVAATFGGSTKLGFGLRFKAMSGTAFNTVDIEKNAIGNSGVSPGPTSNHTGVTNVVFCDGHTSSLSHSIDKKVYAKLLSHAGSRNGESELEQGY